MRIRLSDPSRLDELHHALRKAECLSTRADDDTLFVLPSLAVDEAEARTELVSFIRAWRARCPDVDVSLVG
jgi:hypothetical protein